MLLLLKNNDEKHFFLIYQIHMIMIYFLKIIAFLISTLNLIKKKYR